MEEIKIGEYIRTKKGTIARIKDTEFDICFNLSGQVFYKKWICDKCFYEEIVKHSKNIIDLVQAGDIIKYKINSLRVELGEVEKYTDIRSFKKYLGVNGCSLEEVDILEILTKEKFENDCYKVEE